MTTGSSMKKQKKAQLGKGSKKSSTRSSAKKKKDTKINLPANSKDKKKNLTRGRTSKPRSHEKNQKAKKPKAKMGRKLKLHPDWPLLAEGHAREGMIDAEIAKKLGIAKSTFYEYKKKFPDFSEAISRGKAPVDFKVENSLLKRCTGFEHIETTTEYEPPPKKTAGGRATKPKIVKIKTVTKYVIPDFHSIRLWLTNRKPKSWKDKQDVSLSGDVSIQVISAVPRRKKKHPGQSTAKKPKK